MTRDALGEAVGRIAAGALLAYPTETVWGLGADARSASAVARLLDWKGRDPAQPLSLLVEGPDALAELDLALGPGAERLAKSFWPGPLTLVVSARTQLARGVAREQDGAVGLRCSSHPLAAALARRLRREGVGPITATSLNRSGAPPARTRAEARALCAGGEAVALLAVEGAEAGGEPASTVVDATGARPRVLRWGAVAREALEPVLREMGCA